ncbi:ABC transporter permease [Aestuariimicrobium kwangyangense]|uniref:ABC transporter permease n=1 Tax=Aestuariimicrobium kwangyangense TaxID=396389 RepID=UPI0003B78A9D|nr:FtsX-like permease family protein [Aestuariimicrobium kwangyangense]
MWKATFTSLWARKLRLAMSTLAIILGVAFVSGSFVFSDMIMNSFKGIISSTISDVDVAKDPGASVQGGNAATSGITPAVIERVKQVEGVQEAQGSIYGTGVIVIATSGKALASVGPPQMGFNWGTLPALGGQPGITLLSGREPRSDDEITMDPDTLARSGHGLSDAVKVITPNAGTIEVTVVGTATFGNGSTAGATYVFFTGHRAQQIFLDGADTYTGIWVVTAQDADRAATAGRIQKLLPTGYLARDGQVAADAQESSIQAAMGFIGPFLLIFAGVALLVASFLIVNTFTILVAQRSKELALFRAMGASKRQIMGTVLAEAFVLGVIGSGIGLFAGVGLAMVIKQGMKVMWDIGPARASLSTTAIVAALATGIVVTLLASLIPARRATHIAPIEAMSAAQTEPDKGLGRRAVVGVVLAGVGAVLIVLALTVKLPEPMVWAGAGMAAEMVGVAIASLLLGKPLVWLVGKLYRSAFGEVGKLAALNSLRQPRRTAATASALMVGLTLVSMIAIFGQSARASVVDQVRSTVRGDYIIGQQGFKEFPAQVAEKVAAVDEVQAVHQMKLGLFYHVPPGQQVPPADVLGDKAGRYVQPVGGMQPTSFNKVFTQTITSGRMFSAPREIIVEEETATKEKLRVGSTVTLYSRDAQATVEMTVVGIYSKGTGTTIVDTWVSTSTLEELGLGRNDVYLGIYLKPGADAAAARTALDRAVADMPLVSVMDLQEYTDQMLANLSQTMALLYGLLALSIVIAVLGIVNTLGLSIVERTREIGLLRAIALTRAQVRRMVALESVVIALLGAVIGIVLGTIFGIVLQRVLPEDQGITLLRIPAGQLTWFLVAAVVVGVLAALWPAHQAARTNVLEAIAAE